MVDLDFKVSTRAGERVCKGLLCASWEVSSLREQAEIELGICVNHIDLVAELGRIEALRSLHRRWLQREDRRFFGLHQPQAHHVVGQAESVGLGSCRDTQVSSTVAVNVQVAR